MAGTKRLPNLPCACATIRRAARAVTRLYDDELRACGLRATQYAILQALERLSPVMQSRLGRVLGLDSTTLTRTLRPLEEQGLIFSAAGDDRRERHLQLSPEGGRRLSMARAHWETAEMRLRDAVGEDRWKALPEVLDEVALAADKA